jgi:hypothetical protein
MQGKSCFNFKRADETLFKELEQLTSVGFRDSKRVDTCDDNFASPKRPLAYMKYAITWNGLLFKVERIA